MQNRASILLNLSILYKYNIVVILTFSIVDTQLCWWWQYNRSQPHLFQLLHWYLF